MATTSVKTLRAGTKGESSASCVTKPCVDDPATFVECVEKGLDVGVIVTVVVVDWGQSLINTTKRENYVLKYPRLTAPARQSIQGTL